MRTRIALAAIIPVALVTVSTLPQPGTSPSARAITSSSSATIHAAPVAMPDHRLAAYHLPGSDKLAIAPTSLFLDPEGALLGPHATGPTAVAATTAVSPSAATPAPAVAASTPAPATTAPGDTVTPAQRAAWERVAMCEEGGNWTSSGSRFSGGLGISRANWDAYGGRQFAPVGAMATEDQQIMVAERIQFSPPDQYGCRGW